MSNSSLASALNEYRYTQSEYFATGFVSNRSREQRTSEITPKLRCSNRLSNHLTNDGFWYTLRLSRPDLETPDYLVRKTYLDNCVSISFGIIEFWCCKITIEKVPKRTKLDANYGIAYVYWSFLNLEDTNWLIAVIFRTRHSPALTGILAGWTKKKHPRTGRLSNFLEWTIWGSAEQLEVGTQDGQMEATDFSRSEFHYNDFT